MQQSRVAVSLAMQTEVSCSPASSQHASFAISTAGNPRSMSAGSASYSPMPSQSPNMAAIPGISSPSNPLAPQAAQYRPFLPSTQLLTHDAQVINGIKDTLYFIRPKKNNMLQLRKK